MSRPMPSGNTVSTVSTAPLRMSASRPFGSTCSATDNLLWALRGSRRVRGQAARLTNLSGVPGPGQGPRLLYRDRYGRDEDDQQKQAQDADGVAAWGKGRQVVERGLVMKAHDEQEQEGPDEPVPRPGHGAQRQESDEGRDRDLPMPGAEERVGDPAAVELTDRDQVERGDEETDPAGERHRVDEDVVSRR